MILQQTYKTSSHKLHEHHELLHQRRRVEVAYLNDVACVVFLIHSDRFKILNVTSGILFV